MKNVILITSLLAVSTAAVAKGGFQDSNHYKGGKGEHVQQGFVDESRMVKSVSEALKADDYTPVLLVGSIVKQIDSDEFIFKDSTGEVQIDVKKRAWGGQTITPQDTIEIQGKVDKEWSYTEIDVHRVTKK
ncbi:hypothetical protein A1D29_01900 [Pasteurellaceae bacterium Orientalotternb1]|nr:hypothetical protein A1D29_01900 [Pasteurellaceae bacterium Orientalotternb1]